MRGIRADGLLTILLDGHRWLTRVVCDSAICRIHPSEYPAIHDAERCGTNSKCGGQFCSRRVGTKPEIAESVYGQPVVGRNGSNLAGTKSVLGGLPGVAGTVAVCRSRLRTVSVACL